MDVQMVDKLVRDNIPQIIKADGCTPIDELANQGEYKTLLLNKLVEV